MRTTPRARRAAIGLCLILGGTAVAPLSAPAWERPVALSPSTPGIYVQGPRLVVNESGDALLAWARGRAPADELEFPPSLWVEASSWSPVTERWEAAQRLSPPDELALDPWPSLQPSGRGVVWWTTVRRGVADITMSEAVRADGAWSVTPLDALSEAWVERDAMVAPDGTLAVGELDPWNQPPRFRVRVRPPGGAWRTSTPIRVTDERPPVVLALADGSVMAAWLEWDSGERTRLSTRVWDPRSGVWDAPRKTAGVAGDGASLRIVATPDGGLVAVVELVRERGFAVATVSQPTGGVFGAPRVLWSGRELFGVQAAASATGEVFVAVGAADGPQVRVRRPDGRWSRADSAPRGVCVAFQVVTALAAGPSGEALVVGTAYGEGVPGPVRAWVRRPDGTWAGPVWLSGVSSPNPVAAIDGTGRLHVAWSREWIRYPSVEVTTSAPADVPTGAVPQDLVTVVSRVRVVARGRARIVRFRLSRPGRVTVSVRSATPRRDSREVSTTVVARRGANAVPLRVRGPERVPRGRWTATVRDDGPFVTGCPVTSAPFRVR